MQIRIASTEELGLVLRAVRKQGKLRLDDFAALAQVSKQFATDIENGKATAQVGLVLKVLAELGIGVTLEIPSEALDTLEALRAKRKA